jgi:Tfp pilus assembly protein PilN
MAIRVPINLASDPFRRDRPVLVASVALGAVLLVVLVFQIFTIVSERRQAADTRLVINRLDAQMKTVDAEQHKLDATLHQPQNSEVLERSVFLNSLIERKSISWTRIFSDLEKVVPHNVRLVSVRLPQVDTQNLVQLDMVVSATDAVPVLDLLRKLEESPQFGPATVLNSLPPSQTDPFVRYHLQVSYAQKL